MVKKSQEYILASVLARNYLTALVEVNCKTEMGMKRPKIVHKDGIFVMSFLLDGWNSAEMHFIISNISSDLGYVSEDARKVFVLLQCSELFFVCLFEVQDWFKVRLVFDENHIINNEEIHASG